MRRNAAFGVFCLTTVYPTDTLGAHGNSGGKSAGKDALPSGKGRKCPEISGNRYSHSVWEQTTLPFILLLISLLQKVLLWQCPKKKSASCLMQLRNTAWVKAIYEIQSGLFQANRMQNTHQWLEIIFLGLVALPPVFLRNNSKLIRSMLNHIVIESLRTTLLHLWRFVLQNDKEWFIGCFGRRTVQK